MKPRHWKLAAAAGLLLTLGVVAALVLRAFNSNLVFFYTPSQVSAGEAPNGRVFRVGGLVEPGSLQRDGVKVSFRVTDTARTMTVAYEGILPDLFKEGKGAVAQGKIGDDGVFMASEVLAKHDENYMPPEAAQAVGEAHARALTKKAQETVSK